MARSPLRSWPVWQLPRWLAACVTAVIAAYAAAIAVALASGQVRPGDLRLCAVFIGCGAASVELTRRAGEREGVTRDVYAIWDLPAAVLLPPLYALVIPLPRAVLTEWRIRRTLPHRRAYTTAAHGLSYATASLVFRSAAPALCGGDGGSGGHAPAWITLAAGCGLVSMAIQACLVLPPVKATAAPGTRLRSLILGQEAICNQVTELCLAVLTAFAAAHSALASVMALPLVIVLQRSLRHASLAAAARTDAKTGLLNAGTWQREATVEVTRAAPAQTPLAVAIADIDHFKAVNDTHGHLAGDAVLAAVSAAMRDLLRDCDLCCGSAARNSPCCSPAPQPPRPSRSPNGSVRGSPSSPSPGTAPRQYGSPSSVSPSPARPAAPSMTSSPPPTTPSTRPRAAAATVLSYMQTPGFRRPASRCR